MKRLLIIDGFRGFFLIFMAVAHYDGLTQSILGKLNHHSLGWVEDAQGFVFISGLAAGLVYGGKFLRNPTLAAAFRLILARVRTIYSHQVALVVILLSAALLLGSMAPPDMEFYQDFPVSFTLSSLLLVSSSSNMGILPMYIFFLLATPFAFMALYRGQVVPYATVIVLLWLAAQTSLPGIVMYQMQLVLNDAGVPARFGLYFSLFAWQALFFSGLYVGFRMAQGKLDLGFLHQPQFRTTFFIALGAMASLAAYDLVVQRQLLGEEPIWRFVRRTDRSILSFVYVINFALDLFVIVWLVQVGGTDPAAWVRRLSEGVRWLFTRPFLTVLGQHSLHVFTFHILVYYVLATLMPLVELSSVGRAAVLVASVSSLYLAAFGHQWLQNREAERAVTADVR